MLFVTNGHGEVAIARRIAAEVRGRTQVETDHFALVGEGLGDAELRDVGPQRSFPSGGLVAMGNVGAFARDLAAGFLPFWFAQRRFLRAARGRYAVVVAVGDVYAFARARGAGAPTVFVGTAKSVRVAPYGRFERRLLRGAARAFVRDLPTAADLNAGGVRAEAPGNVIVDLAQSDEAFPWSAPTRIVVLPGSRASAYANAAKLGAVLRSVRARRELEVVVSVAPGIDGARLLEALGTEARAWTGPLGALFAGATLAFGQAGTANEEAAARGLPVVALAESGRKREDWYRMRQRRLLGEALAILPVPLDEGARAFERLLDDDAGRAAMRRVALERMGPPGGAAAIAQAIVELAAGDP
ncbi:MAG: hypothetical protein JO140_02740 [Candidatus Eremiobacteraeota bacterium]|nr:hypothetical protein [Candidatus Eremiobacteraeota bacterium]